MAHAIGRPVLALSMLIAQVSGDRTCDEVRMSTPWGTSEKCSEAFDRGIQCARLYSVFQCCTRCDPCGMDGTLCGATQRSRTESWISPECLCDQVVVTGACSYRGCAKPDAIGVYTRMQPARRTADGRYVYARDPVQPVQMHLDVYRHKSFDDSSGSNASTPAAYLYYLGLHGVWAIGPSAQLTDDTYARSTTTSVGCPTGAASWRFWWGGGISPLGSLSIPLRRGWAYSPRYPLQVSCWANPPSPPPPPPRPPPPPPPPPPMPPPPVRLVPGPYTGRLEIYYTGLRTFYDSQLLGGIAEGGRLRTIIPTQRTVSEWGTVCDDGFDLRDATVACRQLGLGRALRYWSHVSSSRVSAGDDDDDNDERLPRPTGPVWLENMQCGGEEAALADCGLSMLGKTDCSHDEDVHLLCAVPPRRPPPPPPPPPETLFSGLSPAAVAVVGMGAGALMMALLAALVLCFCLLYWRKGEEGDRSRRTFAAADSVDDMDGSSTVLHIKLSSPNGGETPGANEALAAALSRALERPSPQPSGT